MASLAELGREERTAELGRTAEPGRERLRLRMLLGCRAVQKSHKKQVISVLQAYFQYTLTLLFLPLAFSM